MAPDPALPLEREARNTGAYRWLNKGVAPNRGHPGLWLVRNYLRMKLVSVKILLNELRIFSLGQCRHQQNSRFAGLF